MDETEFHKRVRSNIKPIGAEQEKKLKEFLVSPLLLVSCLIGKRKCVRIFLDSMIKMMDLLLCANISRNVREKGKIGIGMVPPDSR